MNLNKHVQAIVDVVELRWRALGVKPRPFFMHEHVREAAAFLSNRDEALMAEAMEYLLYMHWLVPDAHRALAEHCAPRPDLDDQFSHPRTA